MRVAAILAFGTILLVGGLAHARHYHHHRHHHHHVAHQATFLERFTGVLSGKGSWFGDAPGWRDPMNGSTTASGRPTSVPGIALRSRKTLGKLFEVTTPDGRRFILPQTDYGPARWTGRLVDITAGAATMMGFNPHNFPTDAHFTVRPASATASRDAEIMDD